MEYEEIVKKVKDIIVDKLGVEPSEVTETANFTNDLGADSLDTVELLMEFERVFGIKIPDEETSAIATVQDAIDKYKSDNDWMAHFLEACCEVGEGFEEKSGELYSSYRAFAARTNDFCRSTTEFYTSLEQRGFTRWKQRTGMFVKGLRLAETESDF